MAGDVPSDLRALIDIPCRPEADAFPMLDSDAFADLAAGIREHGQIEPIELDVDGAIGDGRNRYATCRWLGIEPRCITLPAETDWFARVVERNLNRRHATSGARAVALVKADASRRRSNRALARMVGLSEATIRRAAFLVEHGDDDLVRQVERGGSLLAAYEHATGAERRRVGAEREALETEARRIARLEELERERARLVAAVQAAAGAVGASVLLPPEPELALRIDQREDVERLSVPTSDLDVAALKAQERALGRLARIKGDLATIRDADVDSAAPMFEGFVMAVRSWASQVIAVTYEIVEKHNAALATDTPLRRVK